ncbi:hypothetical protein BGZ75_010246 [Mortierella antarctica]|nr:hypothetical protein BGZ75_010246 [Mortierella antarctica]
MMLVQPGILLSLSLLLLRAGALAETGTRGDGGLEIPGNGLPQSSTESADIAVAFSNEAEIDDDPCTITDDITSATNTRTATEGCVMTITAPVTITETVNDKTYTRTVTNGDQTSFPVAPCPTAGRVIITETVNGQTYTRTVTNGEQTSFLTPTTRPVVITETINDQTMNTTCDPYGCVQQGPTTAMCMIDCQVNLQIGLIYNIFNGTVSNLSPSTGKTTLLFDSDGTGSINANAGNILQTEYKSNTLGQVFKAQPGGKFIGAPNLNNPTGGEWTSLGARQDSNFMMAAALGNGNAYYFPADSTEPAIAAVYTDLPGNSVVFCNSKETCFTDLAFDDGEPIASPKVSVGIAFDAFGNIYYSGGTYLGGF